MKLAIVVALLTFAVCVHAADLSCRRKDANIQAAPHGPNKYRVCVVDGTLSGTLTVKFCTAEKYTLGSTPSKDAPLVSSRAEYICTRGTVTASAWLSTFAVEGSKGPRVLIMTDLLAVAYPAAEMYKNIGCVGFFTSLAVNPSLPSEPLENLFQKLQNCNLQDTIKDKATARGKATIGFLNDVIGAIPTPHTIVIALLVKAVMLANELPVDIKEADWLGFLSVHYAYIELKLRCGDASNAVLIKQCLSKRKPVSGIAQRALNFKGCASTTTPSSDIYLKVTHGGSQILTTAASWHSKSVLFKLCSAGTVFFYTKLQIDGSKPLCFQAWDRNSLSADEQLGPPGCISPLSDVNEVKVPVRSGTLMLEFEISAL